MKDLKKMISASLLVMCMCMSLNLYGQTQQHKDEYNSALYYYQNNDYQSALTYLNSFMALMEQNPGAWVDPGAEYVEFIYRVYRLAAGCYYNSSDSDSADVIVDNLVYVLSDYFYEADIISRYNNTSIGGY